MQISRTSQLELTSTFLSEAFQHDSKPEPVVKTEEIFQKTQEAKSSTPASVHNLDQYTPLAQWKAMTKYIKNIVATRSDFSEKIINQLLTFNAQYLVRIADYPEDEQERDTRHVSPLNKKDLTYYRFYSSENRLLV